ncbi:Plasmodium exported protein (PHISTb), unknown function [Plasmodium sp. gorilla clade G2]|uniref:Plasmodium exported protein (PHISTb), unknown function n=1 Tax=Plasmodium sp. gorilla clade G2 TaxID=880535 RepID=UPI000D217751|nr:Plasmodium exported protein (PHISTb), unknown function [Plasmodium sp. gorilla clade G2]SOV13915.1 Plasmodium exported protein (PHISTb), unknown function [Plasmodium sp. gorilla clade G2]
MSTFKRSNSNTTEEIVYSNSSKSNGRKISLKSLFSRPSLLAPVVGIIYVILLNVCSYECNNAVGIQSNNLYNRNLAEAESAPEGVMESTKSSSNLFSSPHEHAESIIQKALNEGDSVFDGYKNLFSNLKEEEPYKRYNLNGLGEKNPLFTNGVDKNLNKKIKDLVQNGYKNKQEMDELWKEVNKNEKDKYDNLGKDIFGHYVKTKGLYDTPPRFAEATWKTVNEIYMLTEKNTESYLKVIFYDWFNGNKTTAEEFYLLLCATKLVWRTVMDNINHSCMGMLTKCFELKKTTGKELSCTMILNKYKDAFSGTTRSRHSFVTNVEKQEEVQNYVPTKHNYENCLKTAPYVDEANMPGYFLKSEYDEQPVHEHLENAVTNKQHPKKNNKEENKHVQEYNEQENTEVENTQEENTEQENTEVENTQEENTEQENTEVENTQEENTEQENTEDENTEEENKEVEENTEQENTEDENTEEENKEVEENTEQENTEDENTEEENTEEENTEQENTEVENTEEENTEEENTEEENTEQENTEVENTEEENTEEEDTEEEENKEEEEENTEDEDEDEDDSE